MLSSSLACPALSVMVAGAVARPAMKGAKSASVARKARAIIVDRADEILPNRRRPIPVTLSFRSPVLTENELDHSQGVLLSMKRARVRKTTLMRRGALCLGNHLPNGKPCASRPSPEKREHRNEGDTKSQLAYFVHQVSRKRICGPGGCRRFGQTTSAAGIRRLECDPQRPVQAGETGPAECDRFDLAAIGGIGSRSERVNAAGSAASAPSPAQTG